MVIMVMMIAAAVIIDLFGAKIYYVYEKYSDGLWCPAKLGNYLPRQALITTFSKQIPHRKADSILENNLPLKRQSLSYPHSMVGFQRVDISLK